MVGGCAVRGLCGGYEGELGRGRIGETGDRRPHTTCACSKARMHSATCERTRDFDPRFFGVIAAPPPAECRSRAQKSARACVACARAEEAGRCLPNSLRRNAQDGMSSRTQRFHVSLFVCCLAFVCARKRLSSSAAPSFCRSSVACWRYRTREATDILAVCVVLNLRDRFSAAPSLYRSSVHARLLLACLRGRKGGGGGGWGGECLHPCRVCVSVRLCECVYLPNGSSVHATAPAARNCAHADADRVCVRARACVRGPAYAWPCRTRRRRGSRSCRCPGSAAGYRSYSMVQRKSCRDTEIYPLMSADTSGYPTPGSAAGHGCHAMVQRK